MRPQSKEVRTQIVQLACGRAVIFPDDFFLEGEEIILRQDRDGLITIFPGTEHGRLAMWRVFSLFGDQVEGMTENER